MKSEVMRTLAEGLVSAIRKHVHEVREGLEARIKASDSVTADLRADAEKLQQRIDMLESSVAELQRTLQLRRVA